MPNTETKQWEELVAAERKDMGWLEPDSDPSPLGPSGEPRVARTRRDLIGLTLSGGGIRSATFALGLLQSLHRLELLENVHYLSTVSGGGYVGSWWTAWRYRRRSTPVTEDGKNHEEENRGGENLHFFPDSGGSQVSDEVEHSAIRHLREFSNFLVPRIGFFEVETWSAVVIALGSLLPSLLITLAIISLVEIVWLALAGAGRTPWGGFSVTLASTAFVFAVLEIWQWSNRKKHGTPAGSLCCYIFLAILAAASAASVHWLLAKFGSCSHMAETHAVTLYELLRGFFFAPTPKPQWHYDPYLYWGAFACLATAAVGFVGRSALLMLSKRCFKKIVARCESPLERVLMRLLGVAFFGLILALIWEAAFSLRGHRLSVLWASLTAGGSAGAFALLRNWWQQVDSADRSQGWLSVIRPYLGMVLAYVAVGLIAIVTAALLPSLPEASAELASWLTPLDVVGIAAIIVLLSLFLPPEEFGLHDLYRRRLARAYLGASNMRQVNDDFHGHERNRQTDLRDGDDVRLADLKVRGDGQQRGPGRPLHLICCAANDVAGDAVANLGRGARSAVLSPHGISIGDAWSERPDLLLSSAMTASAAAFNSQMGQKSMKLGPAVAFLMTALNLRLGLWERHPASPLQNRFGLPGLRRLKEMFSWTFADGVSDDVHLSDGAHFENMGLYELVRRHCRYLIVSDGTADPDVQFEDFGNAVRRIRTDFGVDIDIDLTPLKPDSNGVSRQHMAVGTIRYDASGADYDVGIILYFKPSLTGDEPCDIANYKRLNPKFPHETTGDQFYNEAQWESYRRLGAHAVHSSLAFLERVSDKTKPPSEGEPLVPAWVQRAFSRARDTWFATAAGFDETAADLRQELGRLEVALAEPSHQTLAAEIYPDFTPAVPPGGPSAPPPPDTLRQMLPLLIQMVQLIEQVYTACDLDKNFNHPHVLIWMNTFHRWCQAPTFRRVWPILAPLVEPAARRFAEDRFGLPTLESKQLTFHPEFHDLLDGLSLAAKAALAGVDATSDQPSPPNATAKYVSLKLNVTGLSEPFSLEVGVWRLWQLPDGNTLEWADNEFVIYKGYWGAGLGGGFLRQFLKELSADRSVGGADHGVQRGLLQLLDEQSAFAAALRAATHLQVRLRRDPRGPRGTRDIGHLRERNDLVLFYKAIGFQTEEGSPNEVLLRASLVS